MPPISFDFRDSSVLVTGGTQGIGLAVAEAYARAGANVAICARTEGDVSATVAALDELGAGAVYGVTADLGEPDGAGQLYDDVGGEPGRARHPGQQRGGAGELSVSRNGQRALALDGAGEPGGAL